MTELTHHRAYAHGLLIALRDAPDPDQRKALLQACFVDDDLLRAAVAWVDKHISDELRAAALASIPPDDFT